MKKDVFIYGEYEITQLSQWNQPSGIPSKTVVLQHFPVMEKETKNISIGYALFLIPLQSIRQMPILIITLDFLAKFILKIEGHIQLRKLKSKNVTSQ